MDEARRAAQAEAEAEFEALGLPEPLCEEIEALWFGTPFERDLAVEKLVVATINGTGLSARSARALLSWLYE